MNASTHRYDRWTRVRPAPQWHPRGQTRDLWAGVILRAGRLRGHLDRQKWGRSLSVYLTLALVMMGASLTSLRLRLGRQWLLRPFSLLMLAATLYHGVSELVIRAFGGSDLAIQRPGNEFTDIGALVAASTMLVMTLAYLAVHPPRRVETNVDRDQLARIFDWRLTGLLTIPLFIATVQGHGYITGNPLNGEGIGITGLSMQFFLPMVVVTAFGILLRHPRWWPQVVGGQCVAVALAGQRLEVFIAAVLLAVLAARVGIRPTRRQVLVTGAVAGLLAVGVGSVRATQGRTEFYSDTGSVARLQAIAAGVANPTYQGIQSSNMLTDAALRLDSNAWAGQVSQSLAQGKKPIGYEPLYTSALGLIPSVLYPSKLVALTVYQISPELWISSSLDMPLVDYLPGDVTTFYGALSVSEQLIFGLLVGLVLGLVELRSLRDVRPGAVVLYLILVESALFFERGLPFYLYSGRTFLVMAGVLWLWAKLRPATRERLSARGRGEPLAAGRREAS